MGTNRIALTSIEQPYHMNEPGVVAITGKSGYIHRIYTLPNGKVSAVFSPAGGLGTFGELTSDTPEGSPFWEIYSLDGDLFEDVERFATEEEMEAHLKNLALGGK